MLATNLRISRRTVCVALLLAGAVVSGAPGHAAPSVSASVVENAAFILREIGVEELCHPSTSEYAPLLPLCPGEKSLQRRGRRKTRVLSNEEGDAEEQTWFYVTHAIGAVVCVLLVALISCMFLGFLTLDVLDLQIKIRASVDVDERKYATALLPVVRQHHRLLVTLLLLNALAYETLPIFLDNLMPSWAAILLSVTFLLVFGEIIPSAIFTGPDQLRLASYLTSLLKFFMCALYPIAQPLTKLLDLLVPHDETSDDTYHRGELSALVRIQHEEREAKRARGRIGTLVANQRRVPDDDARSWRALKREIIEAAAIGQRSRSNSFTDQSDAPSMKQTALPLHIAEVKMVEGALAMKTKIALDVYTPMRKMFAVPSDMVLTKENITAIYSEGYSRIPVYNPDPERGDRRAAIRGFLLARQLILIDWDDEREVSTIPLQIPPCVSPRMNLVDLLQILQQGGSLMAFVCARPDVAKRALEGSKVIPVEAGFMGLVTLEDVVESLLQDRIYDEEDVRDQNLASARLTQWAASVLQGFVKSKAKAKGGRARDGNADTREVVESATGESGTDLNSQPLPTQFTPLLGNSSEDDVRYSST